MKPLQSARPSWSEVVLVCGKCARKAGRKRFAKELKGALKDGGMKRVVRVVETGCLDLCPKRRLTIATTADLAAGRLTVLAADASATAALDHIRRKPADPRDVRLLQPPVDSPQPPP